MAKSRQTPRPKRPIPQPEEARLRLREIAADMDDSWRGNPWPALAIAAGAGLLISLLGVKTAPRLALTLFKSVR